jgi:plastocyanin
MHIAALHLAPILAEKSRVPFFIAGGVLAGWAVFVSVALGLRMPQFPGGLGGQRAVMAISAALVLAATSTAVITSSPPAKESTASAAGTPTTPTAPPQQAPAPSSTGAAKPPASSSTTTGATAPAPAAHTSLKLAASPSALAYDTKQLSAKAGTVTITFTNTSALEHDVAVAQGSTVLGSTPTFAGGGSKTLTLNLRAGTYTFYCTVPGHRQGGMEGTLTVS